MIENVWASQPLDIRTMTQRQLTDAISRFIMKWERVDSGSLPKKKTQNQRATPNNCSHIQRDVEWCEYFDQMTIFDFYTPIICEANQYILHIMALIMFCGWLHWCQFYIKQLTFIRIPFSHWIRSIYFKITALLSFYSIKSNVIFCFASSLWITISLGW